MQTRRKQPRRRELVDHDPISSTPLPADKLQWWSNLYQRITPCRLVCSAENGELAKNCNWETGLHLQPASGIENLCVAPCLRADQASWRLEWSLLVYWSYSPPCTQPSFLTHYVYTNTDFHSLEQKSYSKQMWCTSDKNSSVQLIGKRGSSSFCSQFTPSQGSQWGFMYLIQANSKLSLTRWSCAALAPCTITPRCCTVISCKGCKSNAQIKTENGGEWFGSSLQLHHVKSNTELCS